VQRYIEYIMIQSFEDADTKELFEMGKNKRWRAVQEVAKRKLDMVEAAINLMDFRIPPGNQLEALKGDRKGQHSIRIHDQYRVCFVWKEDGAHSVEVVDYH
jgi:proteic killer suppression protein